MQSKVFSTNKTLNIRSTLIDLTVPKVMGILNITPDSFYDGGRFTRKESFLNHVEEMIEEGADFIDVGGYSTRPGAVEISETEERHRVIPALQQILKEFPRVIISVDTVRAAIAREAILEGASLINDVSGGEQDVKMFEAVADLHVPYCIMHMRGTPQTMTKLTHYDNLMKEIVLYFNSKIKRLHELGVMDIIVDPGFGFAKTPDQNFELLNHLDYLQILGKPILAGLSRKSMIWKTLDTDPQEALNGTTALNTMALIKGAGILRVHDVREAVECIRLVEKTTHTI